MQSEVPELLESVRQTLAESEKLLQRMREFIKQLEKVLGKQQGSS